ncbi:MAG: DUF402 domain-containing protein [Desulfobacterota bacterium]|nr:DUF402 domain-containing protein [Thermodesulfobacteriota bacterium]
MQVILERKRHKNKPDEHFPCTLLLAEHGYVVLWYRAPRPGMIRDILLPAGTCTVAHYWENRGYVLWRMFYPCATAAGTLFHICSDVRLLPHEVSYLDLILDIWVSPAGAVRILDEDELTRCRAFELVSESEHAWINEQQLIILETYQQLIAEARQHDAYLDILKGALQS